MALLNPPCVPAITLIWMFETGQQLLLWNYRWCRSSICSSILLYGCQCGRALLYFTERKIYVVNATNVFCKAFLLSLNNMLSVASYIDALCLFFVTNLELIVGLIVFANPLIDGFIKTDAPNASLAKYVSP